MFGFCINFVKLFMPGVAKGEIMKFRIANIFIIGLLALVQSLSAAEAVYLVGGFNNWDISHPVTVAADDDGLFETDIDFSNNQEFKLSTVNPKGDWNMFDTGTLYPLSGTKADVWIAIKEFPKSPNIVAPSKRSYTVKVDLENMRIMFSTGGNIRQPWSGTLPVMYIDTEDGIAITSKEDYLQATYWIDPMGVEGVEAVGNKDTPAALQIRGRGNYTWWGFDKKPYRIKLDKKTALLGMDKSKHFALLAHADDAAAGLRNALGFAASECLGMPWTPATQPLEVVLNGDYIGLYWLTETVRVDKDRVDVVEQADGAVEDVDGGWLVEIDNYDSDPHITVKNSFGQPIWFTYKSPEVLSTEQESYLQTSMKSIQDALARGNEKDASALVDFDVLARYFIVNQLMLDMESFHGSCYLNRQRGETEKWKFGPVWDFGNAFSQGRGDDPRFIFDRPEFSQHWIGEFYAMQGFVDVVKNVWKSFLNGGEDSLDAAIEYRAGQISAAAICDARRWPSYAHSDVGIHASRLKTWLGNSVKWLKEQWGADASVDSVETDAIEAVAVDGRLTVRSNKDMSLAVYSIDGTSLVLPIREGWNTFEFAPGFYFVKGQKFLIK